MNMIVGTTKSVEKDVLGRPHSCRKHFVNTFFNPSPQQCRARLRMPYEVQIDFVIGIMRHQVRLVLKQDEKPAKADSL